MLKKVIASAVFAIFMIISSVFMSVCAFASESTMNFNEIPIISPLYYNINSTSSTLDISGGTSTIKGSVQKTLLGKTIHLTLTCTLQKNQMVYGQV
ncbi:hypothetical protein ACJDU8_09830 [Clostridium sp. WILCCON 0269]|uniref:Uncharacterized protein n=1 Tax=Candidatus Clostridium eludens TaxID=3381663 RepID=A0ABW8SIK4_9CLOT